MNKDAYKILFEVEQQQEPDICQLALVDGVEQESDAWQLWARYQRGHEIASKVYPGQQVYALYWHRMGYWGFVNYTVTCISLFDECTIDNMAQRREWLIVTNKYGKQRRVQLHALGYSVLTTMQYAQRAAAVRNAEDHEKVLLGVMYTRLANY